MKQPKFAAEASERDEATRMARAWKPKVEWALRQIEAHSRVTQGCSDAALVAFQRHHGLELPEAYLRFLVVVGMNSGEFLQGSDLRFEQLHSLQSEAQELLNDDDGPTLPENAFVFCSHQGYQFLFFRVGQGPDPQVHHYLEGDREFKTVAPTFSDWLVQAVRDEFPDVPAGGPEEG
jgi:hypothetical protein